MCDKHSHNSVPNPSADDNTTGNSVPLNQIEANSRNSVPNHSVEEKPTQNKTRQPNISKTVSEKTTFDVQTNQFQFVKLFCCCFVKLIFSAEFHSVPFQASELALPWNSECLGMNVFFRGRTEIVPSLFRGIFSERNCVPNPNPQHCFFLFPVCKFQSIFNLKNNVIGGIHS